MSTKSKTMLKRIAALILCSLLLLNTVIGNGKLYVLAAEEKTKQETADETTSETVDETTQESVPETSTEVAGGTTQEASEIVAEETIQDSSQEIVETPTQEVTGDAVKETGVEDTTTETTVASTQEATQDKDKDKTSGATENTSEEDDKEDESKGVALNLSVTKSDNGYTYIDDNLSESKIEYEKIATVTMKPNDGFYISDIDGYDIEAENVINKLDGSFTFDVTNNITKEDEEDSSEVSKVITVTYSPIPEETLSNSASNYFKLEYDETSQMTTIVGANGWEAIGIQLEDDSQIFDYKEQIKIPGDLSSMNFKKIYLANGKNSFSMDSTNYISFVVDPLSKIPTFSVDSVTSNNLELDDVNGVYISNAAIQVNIETKEDKLGDAITEVYYDNNLDDDIAAKFVTVTDNKAVIEFDEKEYLSDTYWIWVSDEAGHTSSKQSESVTVCIDKMADEVDKISAKNEKSVWDNIQSGNEIVTNAALELNINVNQMGDSATSLMYSTVAAENRNIQDIKSADVDSTNNFKFNINTEDNSNLERTFYIWTVDAAGNKSKETTINVLIDTNAPKLDIEVTNDNETWNNPSSVITNKGITAYLTVEELGEDTSGISIVKYGTSEDNLIPISPIDGKYSFELGKNTENINQKYFIRVSDGAGNTVTKDIDFKIDKVAPSVKITNSSEVSKLTNKEVSVNIDATDDMTGVSKVWGVYIDEYNQLKTVEATNIDGGKYNLLIDINKEKDLDSILYVFAKDKGGNIYANEEMDKVSADAKAPIHMDKKAPTIVSIKNLTANDQGWSDGAVTIEVVVWDKNDIKKLSYNSHSGSPVELQSNQGVQNKDRSYVFTFQTTASEYDEKYKILATDGANNTNTNNPTEVPVQIDTQAPQFQDCIITTLNTSTTAKVFNKLTFGLFFKEAIEVDVRVTDGIISSGYAGVTLYGNGEAKGTEMPGIWEGPEHQGEDGWVKFKIDKTATDMELSLSVTDNVGHTCNSTPKDINDNLLSNVIIIDDEASSISIEPEGGAYVDADGKKWYGNNANIKVEAYDGLAGIKAVAITINGQSITSDINSKAIGNSYLGKETRTLGDNFLIITSQAEISQDGSYLIEVTVTDNADNIATQSLTLYKDTTSPYIKNFEFKGNGNNEGNGKPSTNGYYAYYFKGGSSVTVTAADKQPSSGINAITYYTVNYADDSKGITSSEVTVAVNEKDQITFELPENFKGNVYAKATDHVNNVESNFENPNGVISENAKHHNGNSAVVISLPNSDSKDKNDNPLYKNNIDVDVQLTEIYMGIASVEWSVISDYDTGNNQSGQIVIDNNKNLSGDTANWSKESTDKNLVTSLSNTLTIQNDSNDIKILFKLTDRVGYTTEKEVVVSIDKQAPVIEVTYNNENFDPDFASETEYFKESRTATIVVSERNFEESKVEITITNADGNVPEISAWTESINADEPDKSTYTATIDYSQDGDYTFDIAATDKVGNESADYTEDKFTIDLKIPVIKIDFDNNTPSNGFYYKEKRTATITIEEHNFETTRIEITGTATDETTQITYPQAGSWSDNGDMHTATIEYVGDALYTLNVAYKDKAGNEAEPVDAEEFYVDENVPEIVFEGVENMSAYNDVVAPVVTCTDKNVNKDTVKVSVKIVKATNITIADGSTQGTIEDMANGCRLVMNDFEHSEDSDGIYTLEAEVADKAGNITTQTITFSVNRFGSVYTLSNEMIDVDGSYIKKPIDIVITETNADSIDINNLQIKLTKNGVPSDLSQGQDYSVTESGGDNSWNQYKYTINAGTFSEDGIYIVTINSTDKAGNVNDNSNEAKKAEVWFGVDSTEPIVIPLDIDDKASYNQTQKQATVSVEDNLLLENVRIYLNGEEQNYNVDQGKYTFTIADSTKSQNVEIVATDAAGNVKTRAIKDFFVTTNVIVRMVHNKAVMATCATATAATTVGGVTLFRRRKLKLLKKVKKLITK